MGGVVGRTKFRVDGLEKVTGQARFLADLSLGANGPRPDIALDTGACPYPAIGCEPRSFRARREGCRHGQRLSRPHRPCDT